MQEPLDDLQLEPIQKAALRPQQLALLLPRLARHAPPRTQASAWKRRRARRSVLGVSLVDGRLQLLDPANDNNGILDDLDAPLAILAELGTVVGDEAATVYTASNPAGPKRGLGT